MTFGSFISRLSGALIAGSLAFTLIFAAVHAAEGQRKVTVVSFGLFGGQGVFRREATGAAEIVANRFGADPVVRTIQHQDRRECDRRNSCSNIASGGNKLLISQFGTSAARLCGH
jgi:hypothetical protein